MSDRERERERERDKLTFVLCVERQYEGERRVRVLLGKPEGKRPLGRPRCRWEDNINPYPVNVDNMASSYQC